MFHIKICILKKKKTSVFSNRVLTISSMLDPWPSKNGGLPPWTDRPTMDRWGLLMSIRRIAQALLQESHAFLTDKVWKRGKNGCHKCHKCHKCQMGAILTLFASSSSSTSSTSFSIPYQSISSWTSQNSRVQKNRKPSRDPVPNGDELPGFCQMCVLDSASFERGHNFREKRRISTKWSQDFNLTVEFGECSWCFMVYQNSMVKSMFQSPAESKFLKAGMTLGEWLLADTSDLRSHPIIELYPCANPVPVTGGITLSHELLGVLNTWGETKTTQPSADLNLRVKSRIHKWMTQVWQYDQKQ